MRSHHVNVSIVRAKEDCCDTCLRLSVAAQDVNIGEDERELIREAQRLHASDARTSDSEDCIKGRYQVVGKD